MRTKYTIPALALYLFTGQSAFSKTWVDEDGEAVVVIEYPLVKIISTSTNYYFDRVFDSVRSGKEVRLCVGADDTDEVASDCLLGAPNAEIQGDGDARIVVYETVYSKFTLQAVERSLENGETIRVTIDDFDLFSGYILHKDHMLTEGAQSILNDE